MLNRPTFGGHITVIRLHSHSVFNQSRSPRSLLCESMQAPMAPAFSPSFENLITVSLFTMFREYFWIELLIGSSRYSLALATIPPMTTSSGLNMFISPAMARPRAVPISSMTSMASMSSSLIALRMSLRLISSLWLNLSERSETLPSRSFSWNFLWSAEPDAPVSRQPVFPQ